MAAIATEFLKSTVSGVVFGLLVGILILAWLRFVDRWLVEGVDTAMTDERWRPFGEQKSGLHRSTEQQANVRDRRNATVKKLDEHCRPKSGDAQQQGHFHQDAARRASLNQLDRVSLRWREDQEKNSLDLWSRHDMKIRPR